MKYRMDMQSPDENSQQAFGARLVRALERRSEPAVPADFAARVAAALPPPAPARKKMQAGRTVGLVAAGLLGVALIALAPHATPTFANLAFDIELAVIVQLAGIACWLTVPQKV